MSAVRASKSSPSKMTTCEKSFYLIKKIEMEVKSGVTEGQWLFKVEDIDSELSSGSNKAKSVFEHLKKTGNEFLHLGYLGRAKFGLALEKETIDCLLNGLPDPYLQVVIKETKDHQVLVDKRLQLRYVKQHSELFVRATPETKWLRFEEGFPSKTHLNGNCELTLIVGWEEPEIKLCGNTFLQRLFGDEASKDLTLVSGDGTQLKCHKIIFAGHSDTFSTMLSTKTGMTEAQSGRIEMSENSEEGLRHLLQYFYGMGLSSDDISSDVGTELFQTAHKYGLSKLEDSLLELFLAKDAKWFTPDILLEMYLYSKNVDVLKGMRDHLLFLVTGMNTDELRSCEVFKKLDSVESADLFCKVIDYVQNNFVQKSKIDDRDSTGEGDGGSAAVKRSREN